MTDYKKHISSLVTQALSECGAAAEEQTVFNAVVPAAEDGFGDYAMPCFFLAKAMRTSPAVIAQRLAEKITADGVVERAQAVNGYLNFFINRKKFIYETLAEVETLGEKYGDSDIGKGKTIVIDYSSVNICKSFHIGHLSTTAIGSSLYKIYKALGYDVVGVNHLGDYGTQFGKMIVAFKLWGDRQRVEKEGVAELQRLYVKFHQEEAENPSLTEEARKWFVKIEQGDAEATRLFEFFKQITLAEVKRIYERLDVHFDSWNGESFYNDKMKEPLRMLQEKGLVTESQGAKVVDLSDYGMPPCLLVKSDGSSLYATRDIAAAIWRKQNYDFYKCLYVVAYQQNLHFRQVFKVLELAGLPWAKDLVHVAYGMVSLEEGSMSTRKGNVVLLKDVLDKAVEKAQDIITAKNPLLENKAQVAEQVGVGAVLFSALENSKIKDITFTFDRVLNFDGETAPYLQYTHARCRSIAEKAGMSQYVKIAHDPEALNNPETLRLCKLIASFPQAVKDAGEKYEPSIISGLLIDVAQAFNKFYMERRVISDNLSEQNARLRAVNAARTVLKKGLSLLGIQAPDKM